MTLKYTLVVRHPDTGEAVALRAGDPVPEWATDLVHPDDVAQDEPKPRTRRKPN